jgi:predicted acyltransferase
MPPFFETLETVRIPGVLQRIGIVFFVSAWLYLNCNFVLATAGIGAFILGAIYYIVDVNHYHFGAVFKCAGTHAITVYFLSRLISKVFYRFPVGENHNTHSWLYDTFFVHGFMPVKLS